LCRQCNDGTEMSYGKKDMTITYGVMSRPVFAVAGWHCPVCKECEFDLGEGMRCVETLEAMMQDGVQAAPNGTAVPDVVALQGSSWHDMVKSITQWFTRGR